MTDKSEQVQWTLQAAGDFELSSPSADVLAIPNKKARALLMLLADARNGRRSRQVLRTMLWPNVEDDQAANSLRQCLSQLRRILPDGLIEADLDGVTLHSTSFRVSDTDRRQQAPFFEDAPYVGEEFEDWLRETRAYWSEQPSNQTPVPEQVSAPDAVAPVEAAASPIVIEPKAKEVRRFAVGVLDNEFTSVTGDTPSPFVGLPNRTTEGIIQTLTDLVPVDIFDLRGQAMGFGVAPQGAPDIAIRTVVEHIADQLSLTFTVTRVPSGQRLWGQTIVASQDDMLRMDSITLSAFIGETADRLAYKLTEEYFDGEQEGDDRLGLQAFHLLNRLFQLDPNDFPAIEQAVQRARSGNEERLDSIALSAYATTFLKGEHTNVESELRHSAESLTNVTGDLTPDVRAITLTCLAHALAYVVEDHFTAEELLEQAAKLTPHQAFVWDHFALLRHYQGRSEEAYSLARRAVTLGAHSPFRFSYHTTLAMTATLTGRYPEALSYSKRALSARPNFLAPHRYRFLALALSGKEDEAAKALAALMELDPAIADPAARRGRYALPDDKMETLVEPSFSKILPLATEYLSPQLERD